MPVSLLSIFLRNPGFCGNESFEGAFCSFYIRSIWVAAKPCLLVFLEVSGPEYQYWWSQRPLYCGPDFLVNQKGVQNIKFKHQKRSTSRGGCIGESPIKKFLQLSDIESLKDDKNFPIKISRTSIR